MTDHAMLEEIRAILGEEADIDFQERRIDYGKAVERIAALRAHPAIGTPDNARVAIKLHIDSALNWHEVFDDGRGQNNLTKAETSEMLCRRLLAAIPREQEVKPVWRHKKRGSIVHEIGRGKAQAATGPIDEMEDVVVYEHDGKIWVRAVSEFEDGRFERIAAPPSDSPGSAHQPQGGDAREILKKLIRTTQLLQQNSELCAVNHHGLDFEQQGLPGWLRDTQKSIDDARETSEWNWLLSPLEAYKLGMRAATPPAPVRAAAEPGEWLPIRSAPKDGRGILGVWWSDNSLGCLPEPHIGVLCWAGGWIPNDRKLTHWRPLPEVSELSPASANEGMDSTT